MNEAQILDFATKFSETLAGHDNFKRELRNRLRGFCRAYPLGEQGIFSLFLFGPAGVGKTETARVLHDLLGGDSKLAKISFENYSSQDSLNSLIGSPAGYIGCEGGELNGKVDSASAGVILLDEFEKTTSVVQAFFLELLEEARYTDRLGKEHDLSGFVVVFTSNIKTRQEYNEQISPELRSRFDLVCEFVEPNLAEKAEYLKSLVASKVEKYRGYGYEVSDSDIIASGLYEAPIESLSLREIHKLVTTRLIDCCHDGFRDGE